jgi:hypothetical protein
MLLKNYLKTSLIISCFFPSLTRLLLRWKETNPNPILEREVNTTSRDEEGFTPLVSSSPSFAKEKIEFLFLCWLCMLFIYICCCGSFCLKITKVAQTLMLLFFNGKNSVKFLTKKGLGLHFGRFFSWAQKSKRRFFLRPSLKNLGKCQMKVKSPPTPPPPDTISS